MIKIFLVVSSAASAERAFTKKQAFPAKLLRLLTRLFQKLTRISLILAKIFMNPAKKRCEKHLAWSTSGNIYFEILSGHPPENRGVGYGTWFDDASWSEVERGDAIGAMFLNLGMRSVGMVGVEYIQNILNEFLSDERRELVVVSKFEKRSVANISELASGMSDSEVTCVPTKERGAKDEE